MSKPLPTRNASPFDEVCVAEGEPFVVLLRSDGHSRWWLDVEQARHLGRRLLQAAEQVERGPVPVLPKESA